MTLLGCALAIVVSGLPGRDEPLPPFDPVAEILKVDVAPAPGKAKRHKIDIMFNLAPEAPKGIRLNFRIQREGETIVMKWAGGNPIYQSQFTLETEVRKGLKFSLIPDERLVSGEYLLTTESPLLDQTPEVRKVIEGKAQRFPKAGDPWPTSHEKQKFTLGGPEEKAAELADMKSFVEASTEVFLELNNEAMERYEAAAGEPKTDLVALKKYLEDWMKRMGAAQLKVNRFLEEERGLYALFTKAHAEVQIIGRMIGKRIVRTELASLLKKKNLAAGSVKPTVPVGFDLNYQYPATAATIEKRYNELMRLVDPKGDETAASPDEPGEEKAAGDEKDGEGKEPEAKEEETPKEKGEEEKPKEEAKPAKKGGSGTKDGKKEGKKKSKP